MSDRPWHSRPLTYILLFQLAILGYVSLAWDPTLGAMLYPRFGLFHVAGTLGLFMAAGLALFVFPKAVFNFRFSHLNPVLLAWPSLHISCSRVFIPSLRFPSTRP